MKTKPTSPSRWLASLNLCAVLFGIAFSGNAQIWTNTAFNTVGLSASWGTAANWKPNTVPNGTGVSAVITNNFGQAGHTNPLITLDGPITVNSLTYADSGKSNFSGTISAGSGGTLTFDGTTPTVDNPSNSTLTISAPVTITANGLTKGTNIGNVSISGAITASGPLTVNGGTLNESSGLLTGFTSVLVTNGGTLQLAYTTAGTYVTIPITIYGNGSAADNQGAIDVRTIAQMVLPPITLGAGGARIGEYSGSSFVVLTAIHGSGPLTLDAGGGSYATHTGIFQLNQVCNYSGNTTFYQNGGLAWFMVKLGTVNALPTNTVVTMSQANNLTTNGIIFNLNANSQQLGGLTNDAVAPSFRYMVINSSTATTSTLTLSNAAPYTFSGVIGTNAASGGGVGDNLNLVQIGTSTETLSGVNYYTGSTTINNGAIVGVVGGSCSNSAVTVSPASGTGTLGVSINNTNKQWTCASLTTSGAGTSGLDFNFGPLTPSTTTAPLNVLGNVDFTATLPAISVEGNVYVTGGNGYPLLSWAGSGPTDPTGIALTLPAGVVGNLNISGSTLYLQITQPSPTQPLTWQPGTGTWDTTSPNWKDALTVPYTYVDFLDAVVFDSHGGGGTVTLNNVYSPVSVTASNATYTISGTGAIAGGTGITKNGTGTLTLATTNTYTGANTINSGTLAVSGGGTLGATTTAVTLNGGTLDLGGSSQTNGAVSITAAATSGTTITNGILNGSSYTASLTSGNAIVTAALAGSAGLNKTGAGTLTLGGTNTYTGSTVVTAGELDITNWGTTGLGGVTVANSSTSATLGISGGTLALGANTFVMASGPSTATVNQTGGTVSFNGGFGLIFGNGNSLGGTYNLSGGSLTATANTIAAVRLGVNPAYDSVTFNLSGSGILNLSGAQALQVGRSDSASSSNTVAFYQTGGTATVGNVTVGGGPVSTNVTATFSLTGGSFTAGNFTCLVSNVASSATMTLGGSAQVTLPAFPKPVGTAYLTNDFTTGYLAPNAASANYLTNLTGVYLTANGAKFNVASGKDITVGQVLQNAPSQAGTLTKSGPGKLTLAGVNSYTGNTTVNGGTLAIEQPTLAATSTVLVTNGAVLELDFAVTNSVTNLVLNGVSQSQGVYNVNTLASTAYTGYITGAGSLLVTGGSSAPSPAYITNSFNGTTLTLNWPSSQGWLLQSNSIDLANPNDWQTVSGATPPYAITISANKTNVFYRLKF